MTRLDTLKVFVRLIKSCKNRVLIIVSVEEFFKLYINVMVFCVTIYM